MADSKFSALGALTAPASTDVLPIVDVSDTTQAASGTPKKITRANLLQPNLAAIDGLTSAADKGIQFTGSGTAATYDLTAAGKALLDDADAAAQRTTLGLAIGTNVQAYDADLASLAGGITGLVKGAGNGGGYSAASAGTDYYAPSGTDVAVADGGTGASTAAAARQNLGILETFAVACSDETTALTTGNAKATFRMPYAFTLTEVRASVTTAPTGATLTVDINESGTTILSTKLTIDASEKTSVTAATPAVISDAALADDAEITVDIDQVGSTVAGAGLKVYLIGYKTS